MGRLSTTECTYLPTYLEGGFFVKSLKEHKDMISGIASGDLCNEPVVVSADLAGEIIVWDKAANVKCRLDKSPGYVTWQIIT